MDSTEIKTGDRIRTIYGSVETVVSVIFPMVYADRSNANMTGGGYHHTKIFKIEQAPSNPQARS